MEAFYIIGFEDGTCSGFSDYADLINEIKELKETGELEELTENSIQVILYDPKLYAVGVFLGELFAYRCYEQGTDEQDDEDVLGELGRGELPFNECIAHVLNKDFLINNVL